MLYNLSLCQVGEVEWRKVLLILITGPLSLPFHGLGTYVYVRAYRTVLFKAEFATNQLSL